MWIKTNLLLFPLVFAAMALPAVAEENAPIQPAVKAAGEKPDPPAAEKAGRVNQRTVRINLNAGNRYVFHFLAWIDEPYIAYRTIADPYNGTWHRIPVVRYRRVLVKVYLDRKTNTYGYFDRFGNPVPYLPVRYRYQFNPL